MATPNCRDALRFMALPFTGLAGRPGLLLAQDEVATGRRWWKEAVVYQIYPRPFRASNSDGVGDLPAILSRLDYVEALGVDVVWLCPHYPSLNVDNGYDVSDYRTVSSLFGTMADFDALVAGLKARGIRLFIDLVVNHTSDHHAWFKRSRTSSDAPGRGFYIWRDGRNGGPPSNYPSLFSGSAWTHDETTGQYYLRLFALQQPDLKWDEPRVRAEVHEIKRFWLDRGVSGFRLDAITFISKQPGLPDLTPDELRDPTRVYADGPHRDEYLLEIDREVLSRYETTTVGEAGGMSTEGARALTDARRHELDMVFTFALIGLEHHGGAPAALLPEMRRIIAERDRAADLEGWNASYLANHDQPRSLSLRRPRPGLAHRLRRGPGHAASDPARDAVHVPGRRTRHDGLPFTSIDQFEAVRAKREWREKMVGGAVSAKTELTSCAAPGATTPARRCSGPQASTPDSRPAHPGCGSIPTRATSMPPTSMPTRTPSSFYRRLIALRKRMPALVYGLYRDIDPDLSTVFGYTRTLPDAACLVLMNFASKPVAYRLPVGWSPGPSYYRASSTRPRRPTRPSSTFRIGRASC